MKGKVENGKVVKGKVVKCKTERQSGRLKVMIGKVLSW